MRISIVDSGLAVGGTLVVAANISRGLLRYSNCVVDAIVSVDPATAAPYFADTATVRQLRIPYNYVRRRALKKALTIPGVKGRLGRSFGLLADVTFAQANRIYEWRLAAHLKHLRPDIVHVNNGLEAIAASTSLGLPTVFHLHGLLPQKLSEPEVALLRKVSHFIAVSEYVARASIEAGLPRDKVTVVRNFTLSDRLPELTRAQAKAALRIPDDGHVIGLVGRIVPWKGILEFIAAMKEVAKGQPNVRLLLVGDTVECPSDYMRSIKEQISAAHLESRATFIPHLSDTSIAYRACSVIAHASVGPEPFGMVVIEAMQMGTPVVAASTGGPAEIIEHGVSGFLVDPRDTSEFASLLLLLLRDEQLRERIGAAGRERVERSFGAKSAIESLIRVYEVSRQGPHQ